MARHGPRAHRPDLHLRPPIGAGKTSLLGRLYERLSQDEKYNVALLISPNVKTSNAFLRMVMEAYEVKTERSYDQSLKNFEQFLIKEYKAGRIPLPESSRRFLI